MWRPEQGKAICINVYSLSAIRHGINLHLQRISENEEGASRRDIDIGVKFRESNRVMSAMGKELKRPNNSGIRI